MSDGSERISSGLTFSAGLELLKNHTESSVFGTVRFDRAMLDYHLTLEHGALLPDAASTSAIARMRLMELGEATYEAKKNFDAPSNVMFIPAEYWAVNCCPPCPPCRICGDGCACELAGGNHAVWTLEDMMCLANL